ncbi:TUL4 family lipoprotein [Fastidiosibacter lacustris]|uniref:TUL4 family lipoprotein n=1 Tax=Fastidiosibacter lacustris TaxID=2056695 RepID=UPI000E356C07|nr:TUL4 family lipoprotein [Fastidiosibacter lacustris]
MKRLSILSLISSATLLSACASSPKADTPASPQPQGPNKVITQAMPETSMIIEEQPQDVIKHTNLPSSNVKLSIKGDRLIAKVYTNWNGAKQGDLRLHWIAPTDPHCLSSTFPIMKYKENNDYSWAYRTFEHNSANGTSSCYGTWKAEVLYKPTKVVIGSATLNVPAKITTTSSSKK